MAPVMAPFGASLQYSQTMPNQVLMSRPAVIGQQANTYVPSGSFQGLTEARVISSSGPSNLQPSRQAAPSAPHGAEIAKDLDASAPPSGPPSTAAPSTKPGGGGASSVETAPGFSPPSPSNNDMKGRPKKQTAKAGSSQRDVSPQRAA
jgi:hypothetical protein